MDVGNMSKNQKLTLPLVTIVVLLTLSLLFLKKAPGVDGKRTERDNKKSITTAREPNTAKTTRIATNPNTQSHVDQYLVVLNEYAKALGKKEIAAKFASQLPNVTSSDPERRTEAIREIGFVDDTEASNELLVYALRYDPSAEVRTAAAVALEDADSSSEAIKALVNALNDMDEDVRDNAMGSLKAIRNDLVKKELVQGVKNKIFDDDTTVKVRLFINQYYLRFDPFYDPLNQ